MKKLLIIVPVFARYRVPVFDELGEHYEVCVVSSELASFLGAGIDGFHCEGLKIKRHIPVPIYQFLYGKLFYQSGLLGIIRETHPDSVLICAHSHYISYWCVLAYCFFHSIPVYSHIRGPYNRSISFFNKVIYGTMYGLISRLSTRTLLYTPNSLRRIEEFGWDKKRFTVIYNSIVNQYPVLPEEKDYSKKGILFVGRLREGCNLELLCESIIELKNENYPIEGHIIGSGKLYNFYLDKYEREYMTFYGEIYDQKEISKISKECIIGCYPGNAGLSVVHYMSLSLPCLVHNNIMKHQGPEPSYVKDRINGRLFQYEDKESFKRTIKEMLDTADLPLYGNESYNTYLKLSNPSYAQRIIEVLENSKNQ
jgi:glycosyltransferase involved in cell wall biosynthesis